MERSAANASSTDLSNWESPEDRTTRTFEIAPLAATSNPMTASLAGSDPAGIRCAAFSVCRSVAQYSANISRSDGSPPVFPPAGTSSRTRSSTLIDGTCGALVVCCVLGRGLPEVRTKSSYWILVGDASLRTGCSRATADETGGVVGAGSTRATGPADGFTV